MGFLEAGSKKNSIGNHGFLKNSSAKSGSKPSKGRAHYNARDKTLFAPTNEPINEKEAYLIFDYEPNKGGGDFGSLWNYGLDGKDIADEAGETAERLLPRDSNGKKFTGYEDAQDAVRHALGSYLLTQRFDAASAKDITDRHERGPSGGLSPADRTEGLIQDLYNNRVGREAALNIKNHGRDPAEVIMELYRNNKLQTRPFLLKNK